jgi:dihydropyrimidinase
MPVDTIIRGGTIVTAESTFSSSIAIDDGLIVGVGAEETLPKAAQTIDASGHLVMPGVVDPHVHIDDHVSIDTYQTATSAAALGGITTVIDFAWQAYVGAESPWDEEGSLLDGVTKKRENADEAVIDFGLHGGILREGPDLFDEMEELVENGITSFKMYTAYEFGLSTGYIHEVLDRIAELDAIGVGHTEDDSICESLTEHFQADGKTDPQWYPESRPDYAEATAAESVARIAREVGAKYYGIHTSCRKSADVISCFQKDGSHIRGETCTHYTTLTKDIHQEKGSLPVIAPPLRTADDQDALFEYLRDGTLGVVSTDHVAQTQERKAEGDWWDGPFGSNGLQASLPVFYDEAVNERGHSSQFVVRVMCTNPARTFGLPNKGTLEPGTDADIVLFDPSERYTISAADNASMADYSLYEGREVKGRVSKTLVRGEVVADEGEVIGTPGHGRFVERNLPDWSV